MPYTDAKQLSRKKICRTIRLMQENVGRGGVANDLALALSFEIGPGTR